MTASAMLDRPEFAVLRRLDAEQLGRIRPRLAERRAPTSCPLAQALGAFVRGGSHVAVVLMGRAPTYHQVSTAHFRELRREGYAFVDAWDTDDMSVEDLEAAVAAALAERGATS